MAGSQLQKKLRGYNNKLRRTSSCHEECDAWTHRNNLNDAQVTTKLPFNSVSSQSYLWFERGTMYRCSSV